MKTPVKIPALRGKIGDTVYYSANFTFWQIAKLVRKVDSELHTSSSLKEQIQRSLNDNFVKIQRYILDRSDRFFNALVLAVYDGQPEWTEIRYELEDEMFYNVGILNLNGEEKIFPVDGQHRVEGIKAALEKNDELATETVSVILIGHSNTPEGMERSRRVFSTLNRYAKPVKLGDIIALDEDDVVAIVTRMQLEQNKLFVNDRIKVTNTKSMPVGDKRAFTSLMTLYECHVELFKLYRFNMIVSSSQLKDFLRTRPSDDVVDGFDAFLTDFWESMIQAFPEIRNYVNDVTANAALEYRSTENGGNIFFRPVALSPFVSAVVRIRAGNTDLTWNDVFRRFIHMDRTVSSEPWNKVIWNPINRRMIMRNQTLVKYLFIHMYDTHIMKLTEKEQMVTRYATVLNINPEQARQKIEQILLD